MTESETWNIDELIALTETVQTGEVEYQGKKLLFQYCELTEGEEPTLELPPEDASDDDKNAVYQKVGWSRIKTMVDKANKKNPEGASITNENWDKIPSSVRWGISQAVLGGGSPSFRNVDDKIA